MDIKRDHYDGTKLVTIVSYGQIYTHLANSDGVQVPTGLALARISHHPLLRLCKM